MPGNMLKLRFSHRAMCLIDIMRLNRARPSRIDKAMSQNDASKLLNVKCSRRCYDFSTIRRISAVENQISRRKS